VPIAEPERVSDEFIEAIASHAKTVYVAIHVNHARELSPGARAAIARLDAAGIPLISQAVLLRGVNDNADTLAELMRALVELRIKPYYLHQTDLAPGTSHFRVPLAEAQDIYEALRRQVSGLCLPTFVIDIPGGFGKVPAARSHVNESGDGVTLADDHGDAHQYFRG
jgi:lysine 2,3-aminomutase